MAMNGHFNEFHLDDGVPTGGISCGRGFTISWQNGALGRGNEKREPNGAFVEDVIDAVIRRIAAYQDSKFACPENADALASLRQAAKRLDDRTTSRETRDVEGTHTP